MDGIHILVPSSLVREAEDKREATRKLGTVARAAAVFGASRLVVFPDREGERRFGGEFVETVLSYAATPPELRKGLWGQRDALQYVGVLPPLRLPSEAGSDPNGSESSTQGIVTEVGPEGRVRVNCELQHPISLLVPSGMEVEEGERVTIRIDSREPVRARITGKPEVGFQVVSTDLSEALACGSKPRIATSRHGRPTTISRLATLAPKLQDGFTVAFGSPGRGLPEILGISPDEIPPEADSGADRAVDGTVEPGRGFDLWSNTIPRQASEVVRTEEALFATLAQLTLTE